MTLAGAKLHDLGALDPVVPGLLDGISNAGEEGAWAHGVSLALSARAIGDVEQSSSKLHFWRLLDKQHGAVSLFTQRLAPLPDARAAADPFTYVSRVNNLVGLAQ